MSGKKSKANDVHATQHQIATMPLHIKPVRGSTLSQKWRFLLYLDRYLNSTKHADAFWAVLKYARRQASRALKEPMPKMHPTMELSAHDITALVNANLIKPVQHDRFWHLRTFSVPESHKGRRRWIVHAGAQKHMDDDVLKIWKRFPLADRPTTQVTYAFAAQCDLMSYYHQFHLEDESFGFQAYGKSYVLLTIPTGANWCPALAQIFTHGITMAAATGLAVHADVYLDNIRYVGNDPLQLETAMNRFYELCEMTLVDINESIEETIHAMHARSEYTFLGVEYDHKTSCIRLSAKNIAKLQAMQFPDDAQMTVREFLAAYGNLTYAAMTLEMCRAQFYFVTKLLRRVMQRTARKIRWGSTWTKELDAEVKLWNRAIAEGAAWRNQALQTGWRKVTPSPQGDKGAVLYTDASTSGLGALLFFATGEISILARQWTETERARHININEAVALHEALSTFKPQLREVTHIDVRIDNTTVQAALRNSHSRSYWLNNWVLHILRSAQWQKVRSVAYVKSASNLADLPSRAHSDVVLHSHNPFLWPTYRRRVRYSAMY